MFSFSCSKTTTNNFSNTRPVTSKNVIENKLPIRLLALGDSYTIGESVTVAERFPNQTLKLLKNSALSVEYPADIIARTGWTSQDLLDGIAYSDPNPTIAYDLVTLLIGVNNQYQHLDTTLFKKQLLACINKAIEYSGNKRERVFVLSIPDYGVTPFGASNKAQIAYEIDFYNSIIKRICLQMDIDYTDITTSSRMAANNSNLIAFDGLHPSGFEYAKWAAMLKLKMLRVLK
jgi:lysophospholipase L1-like esterase